MATEISILQSPSVLMPVFLSVKKEKGLEGKTYRNLKYKDFANNISITPIPNTTILEVAYKSTDKEVIIPRLNKVSKSYQEFASIERYRGIRNGIKYLEKQIESLEKKTQISLTKSRRFAIENGLAYQDGLPTSPSNKRGGASLREAMRNSGVNFGALNFNSLTTESAAPFSSLYQRLQNLESSLIVKSALLKPNAPRILAIKSQIKELKAALARPSEILLKHRELVSSATRDEFTLNDFRSRLTTLQLDQARSIANWDVILEPTLTTIPVGPNKKLILISWVAGTFFVSSTIALMISKMQGYLLSLSEFKAKIPYKFLYHLPKENGQKWETSFPLLREYVLDSSESNRNKFKNIAFIPLGNLSDELLSSFMDKAKEIFKGNELTMSKDLIKTNQCDSKVLLAEADTIKGDELTSIIQALELQEDKVIGWIFLDPQIT
tara:strand:- start:1343 stop:2656 length:1314 start_codon:yes stop_codon:yes gene_type:complete